jgi:hypothetical protein
MSFQTGGCLQPSAVLGVGVSSAHSLRSGSRHFRKDTRLMASIYAGDYTRRDWRSDIAGTGFAVVTDLATLALLVGLLIRIL